MATTIKVPGLAHARHTRMYAPKWYVKFLRWIWQLPKNMFVAILKKDKEKFLVTPSLISLDKDFIAVFALIQAYDGRPAPQLYEELLKKASYSEEERSIMLRDFVTRLRVEK